ncbi:MAG: choline dehydrogenase, partial [Rhizobiaceae bacterium]
GSSSINGMVYVRGHAKDFDHWEECGAHGWSYADVQPYFQRAETSHGGASGEGRGTDGPLNVGRGPQKNPLFSAFVEAGRQAGFETTQDYNGLKQEGFGAMEQTVYKGRRWSAANAYLKPALKRENLRMMNCFVRRVVFEGKTAIGVEFQRGDTIQCVRARKEVILAASSINTPKVLMLSGIGPAGHLKDHNIKVLADRPGVGGNLQDHLELYIQQACTQPITLYSKLNLFSKAMIGAQWLFFKTGLGASNQFESAAFVRSRAGVEYPDIQYHFLPVAIRYDGKAPAEGHGFQAHVGPMRSKSRGHIKLTSADPADPPQIQFNYMSHEEDFEDFRHCIRLTREIIGQEAFDPYRGEEIAPGKPVQSDEQLDDYIREHVESAYHPCGTAKMGAVSDPLAVVNPQCQVIGVEGLRVIDTSIFPQITNGNLNGPAIMSAEKASDHILGRTMLAKSNLQAWINPRWRESDR